MRFYSKLLTLFFIFLSSLIIAGCGDRVHESWVEKPAPPVYDDPIIFARINGSVQNDPELQGLDINIEVKDGIVSLNGTVNNAAQAERIVMHAWIVDGVKDVKNQININK